MLAVAGMAIGVMFGMSPIAGSCGGLNAVDGSGACQSCSRPCKSKKLAEDAKVAANKQSDVKPLTRTDIPMTQENKSL